MSARSTTNASASTRKRAAYTLVDLELLADDATSTVVKVTESAWPNDDDGVARALEQTAGWTDLLCSLKAYVLHGINLREGRTADTH
jgi:hypothetical protein